MFEVVPEIIFKDALDILGYGSEKVNECSMVLLSEPSEFDMLYETLKSGLLKKKYTLDTLRKILMCVDEAFSNAVLWGNRNIISKKVFVRYFISRGLFAICLEDEGEGFNVDKALGSILNNSRIKAPIRGIFFISQYMDKVIYSKAGNKIMMIKYNDSK